MYFFSPGIQTQRGDAQMTTTLRTTTREEAMVRTSGGCLIIGVCWGLITIGHFTQTNLLLCWTRALLRHRNPRLSPSHPWREPLNQNPAQISTGTERHESILNVRGLCREAQGWDGATSPLLQTWNSWSNRWSSSPHGLELSGSSGATVS